MLEYFGVPNVCADMTLEGCSEVVRVGLRFEGQEEALVEREVSTAAGHQSACIAASDLSGTGGAIDYACGNAWQICFSIGRMQIGANLLAGCPTMEVGDHGRAALLRACARIIIPPILVSCAASSHIISSLPVQVKGCRTLPDMNLPLQCFQVGFDCSLETDCDKCVANGCGWCAAEESAGDTGQGKCMDGNMWGALCDDCGTNCSCSWNFGKCPMKKADMNKIAQTIKAHEDALANVSGRINRTFYDIAHHEVLQVHVMPAV